MSEFLHLRDLVVTPGDAATPAVAGVSLQLDASMRLGLAGPSGCGKSTLARALVGLEPKLGGSLRHQGHELVGAPISAWSSLRSSVASCWQDSASALDPRLRVRDSIDEARALHGKGRIAKAQLRGLLERVRLPLEFAERKPPQLSGGQRQRAALARALSVEPQLLIADEMTSGLDRAVTWEVVDALAAYARTGKGLLFITHDLSLFPRLVERVIVMDEGRIVDDGSPTALLQRPDHPTTKALVEAIPRLADHESHAQ
jgi:ABC-type glutathione transport system ATPase component